MDHGFVGLSGEYVGGTDSKTVWNRRGLLQSMFEHTLAGLKSMNLDSGIFEGGGVGIRSLVVRGSG